MKGVENTTNAFLCVELTDESRVIEFKDALKDLAKEIQDNLGGTCKAAILDFSNKEVSIK